MIYQAHFISSHTCTLRHISANLTETGKAIVYLVSNRDFESWGRYYAIAIPIFFSKMMVSAIAIPLTHFFRTPQVQFSIWWRNTFCSIEETYAHTYLYTDVQTTDRRTSRLTYRQTDGQMHRRPTHRQPQRHSKSQRHSGQLLRHKHTRWRKTDSTDGQTYRKTCRQNYIHKEKKKSKQTGTRC